MKQQNRPEMIRISGVDKIYRLGQIGGGTLQKDLQSWWARKRGKEDPNMKIGQGHRLYGEQFYALQGIDLTVREGECLGIIGGNGAGKSTLLKLISRVTVPTKGSIDLYGRVTSMLEVGTGFHGEMTGLENVYLNGSILGMSKKETDRVLDQIIEFSEVRDFINTPVKRYSSGMYVKLAFSVAAHLNSEIIIMDEVLAVGDLAFQKKCIDRMQKAAKEENRTVLYVSHNMETVRALCDRCIVMDQGKIIFDGNTEEAIEYYSDFLLNAHKEENLSEMTRRSSGLSGDCRIEDIFVLNGSLRMGEDVWFRIRIRAEEPQKGVMVRLVVSNAGGMIVGMTYSDPVDLAAGVQEIECCFPTNPLAAGVYVCDMALFAFENNIQIRHDFLSKVLSFQIEESVKFFGKKWNDRSWGNVRLSRITVSEVDRNETEE